MMIDNAPIWAASSDYRWPLQTTPERFGAVGDGVTDDTAAIRAACEAMGAVGGTVIFADAKYRVDGTVIWVPRRVKLLGTGWAPPVNNGGTSPVAFGGSTIVCASATCNVFRFEGQNVAACLAFDVTDNTVLPTSGKTCDTSGGQDFAFCYISINRCWDGFYSWQAARQADPGCETLRLDHVYIQNFAHRAISWENVIAGHIYDAFISNMHSPWGQFAGTAIYFGLSTSTIDVLATTILGGEYPVVCAGGVHGSYLTVMDDIHFWSVSQGEASAGWQLSHLVNSTIRSCWIGSNTNDGLVVTGDVYGLRVADNAFVLNRGRGFYLNSTTSRHVVVRDNAFSQNSAGHPGVFASIDVLAGAQEFIIEGNDLSAYDAYGYGEGPHAWGVRVGAASNASDRYIIRGNMISGATIASVADNGTGIHKTVGDNW